MSRMLSCGGGRNHSKALTHHSPPAPATAGHQDPAMATGWAEGRTDGLPPLLPAPLLPRPSAPRTITLPGAGTHRHTHACALAHSPAAAAPWIHSGSRAWRRCRGRWQSGSPKTGPGGRGGPCLPPACTARLGETGVLHTHVPPTHPLYTHIPCAHNVHDPTCQHVRVCPPQMCAHTPTLTPLPKRWGPPHAAPPGTH